MVDESAALERARREIDDIDTALHDLLMRRVELVEDIARAKDIRPGGRGTAVRPAREAMVLRRLMARHSGTLPFATVVRIWREMMAAFTSLQGPFSVIVFGGDRAMDYWDLARFHYGATTPMTSVNSAYQALQMLAQTPGALAVVPATSSDSGTSPWWVHLSIEGDRPRILSRLPMLRPQQSGQEPPPAFTLGIAPVEQSGDDLTMILVRTGEDVTRAWLLSQFETAGLSARTFDVAEDPEQKERLQLLEVEGFLADHRDNRLQKLKPRASGPIRELRVVGTFARALDPSEVSRPSTVTA